MTSSNRPALQLGTIKHLVRNILIQASTFSGWSVQGLGMLRLYLGDGARLHIWDPRLEYEDVSKMHTHSWPLRSTIVAGKLRNTRFVEDFAKNGIIDKNEVNYAAIATYHRQRIRAGIGGERLGEPSTVRLMRLPAEEYEPGETYGQSPEEIHITDADAGTVTLMERPMDPFPSEADVFYPYGGRWVSGFPKPADEHTVNRITQYALERWF